MIFSTVGLLCLVLGSLACCAGDRNEDSFPNEAARLAGMVLMHAAWSISDLPKGENLAPLAMTLAKGQTQVIRFSGSDCREAVSNGFQQLGSQQKHLDAWALAYDSIVHTANGATDAVIVRVWSTLSKDELLLVQPYEPFWKHHHFRLLGPFEIYLNNQVQPASKAKRIRADVELGVQDHGKHELWHAWLK